MKIAITGGSGRIGRATIDLALSQGHTILSLDQRPLELEHPQVTALALDTNDYDAFSEAIAGCDALIHLAAIPSPKKHPLHVVHHNNVVSSYNALLAAAELGINRIAQASSINAVGGVYSNRWPRYDYFPLDEAHPTYAEDPYSLSKWLCEAQADSIALRYESMSIASLRFHWAVVKREDSYGIIESAPDIAAKHLWGYVTREAAARACLLSLTADFTGHETFFIVSPDSMMPTPSRELRDQYFPDVPIREPFDGHIGFYNCQKAADLLGWHHDQEAV